MTTPYDSGAFQQSGEANSPRQPLPKIQTEFLKINKNHVVVVRKRAARLVPPVSTQPEEKCDD